LKLAPPVQVAALSTAVDTHSEVPSSIESVGDQSVVLKEASALIQANGAVIDLDEIDSSQLPFYPWVQLEDEDTKEVYFENLEV
jgi:hypothetical protein